MVATPTTVALSGITASTTALFGRPTQDSSEFSVGFLTMAVVSAVVLDMTLFVRVARCTCRVDSLYKSR